MLQFIVGSSGAGKSTYVFDRIIEESGRCPEKNFLVIVPEQFTLQTQKELVIRHPNKGIMNIDVLSFLRLAFRVFAELGNGREMVLEDMGKSLIVKKVLMEHKTELQYFASNVHRQGFAEEMKSVLSELLQYGIDAEKLEAMERVAGESNIPALNRKMHDVALIYRAFQEFLKERFITTEGIFDRLGEVLEQSEIVRDAVVVLDGFTGFTPSQYQLLRALLKHAGKVYVTVTMDRKDADRVIRKESYGEHRLFYTGYKTMETLRMLASQADCEVDADILLPMEEKAVPYRFHNAPALSHLERHLFRYPNVSYRGVPAGIHIRHFATPKDEVWETVCEIKRLVQSGMRYKDIAVVTGDIAGYGNLLMRYFDEAGIPGFTDQKRSILGNPLVELLRSLLELSEGNFAYDQMFRWAKCPLSGMADEDCDRLENYVLACGIRGKSMWEKEWTGIPNKVRRTASEDPVVRSRQEQEIQKQKEELAYINGLRVWVTERLKPVLAVLRDKNTTTKERIDALRGYLQRNCTEDALLQMMQALSENGNPNDRLGKTLEKEYAQVFSQVEEIFARAEELLAGDRLSVKEFREILETGFSEAKVGLVPPGRDQVVVGDIERTRLQDIKVLFFLGVNEGVIPPAQDGSGILSDGDREFFLDKEIALAPTERQLLYTAEYYLYLNMTKPASDLYVSYADKDAEGKELRPSYLIAKLYAMFPSLLEEGEVRQDDVFSVLGTDGGKRALIRAMKKYREEGTIDFTGLMRLLMEQGEDVTALTEQVFYRAANQQLRPEQVQHLYGEVLRGSVTRLERYAQCALGFFLEYGMKLEEREEYRLSMPELGSMFHEALELFSKKIKEDQKQWSKLTAEEEQYYAEIATAQAVAAYKNEKLQEDDNRTAYMIDRVQKTVLRTVDTIRQQLQYTCLMPEHFEADFHYEAEGLSFRGKIDRIDLYEDEENCYVKIMDYKSGNMKLDLNKVYHGLQLQLGLYLDAVIAELEKEKPGKAIVPAAMLYYRIFNPLVERSDNPGEDIVKELRPDGLLNMDKQVLKRLDFELLPETEDGTVSYDAESGLQPKVNAKYLPVRTKADGELYPSAALATEENIGQMRKHLKQLVSGFKDEIRNGNAKANPYSYQKENACEYCKYKPVCSFGSLNGKEERVLRKAEADKIWETIGQQNKTM